MVVNSAAIANVANRGEARRAAKEQVCALKQLSLDMVGACGFEPQTPTVCTVVLHPGSWNKPNLWDKLRDRARFGPSAR